MQPTCLFSRWLYYDSDSLYRCLLRLLHQQSFHYVGPRWTHQSNCRSRHCTNTSKQSLNSLLAIFTCEAYFSRSSDDRLWSFIRIRSLNLSQNTPPLRCASFHSNFFSQYVHDRWDFLKVEWRSPLNSWLITTLDYQLSWYYHSFLERFIRPRPLHLCLHQLRICNSLCQLPPAHSLKRNLFSLHSLRRST